MTPCSSSRRRPAVMEPEVIEISDNEDAAPLKPARPSRTRKPIFIDLSELSDNDESENPRCSLACGNQDNDIDVDDGAPFPEVSLPLPPPCTYEQVLAGVEPEMRKLAAQHVLYMGLCDF